MLFEDTVTQSPVNGIDIELPHAPDREPASLRVLTLSSLADFRWPGALKSSSAVTGWLEHFALTFPSGPFFFVKMKATDAAGVVVTEVRCPIPNYGDIRDHLGATERPLTVGLWLYRDGEHRYQNNPYALVSADLNRTSMDGVVQFQIPRHAFSGAGQEVFSHLLCDTNYAPLSRDQIETKVTPKVRQAIAEGPKPPV